MRIRKLSVLAPPIPDFPDTARVINEIIVTIRPYHSTTYVDVAYCYRPSSVVCRSVRRSVTLVSTATTDEPIEMPFGFWAPMAQGIMY